MLLRTRSALAAALVFIALLRLPPTILYSASLGLSVAVLDQLKQGAEKSDESRRLYPFEATLERRTARVPETGPVTYIVRENETFQSETWEPPYRPGNIVEYSTYASFNAP